MSQDVENQMRCVVANYLPAAIEKTMSSYALFLEEGMREKTQETDKTKNFKTHHEACKVALAHVALLIKLAGWSRISARQDDENLRLLIENAQAEIEKYDMGDPSTEND